MTRTKLGLLGLCAVVFGLMAFNATAAQAIPGVWLFSHLGPKGEELLLTFLPAEAIFEKESGTTYVLHSEILKIKVLFLCTEFKLVGSPKLEAEGKISNAKVLFSGCTTDLNGVANANCTPKDAVDGSGTIVTNTLHAVALLHKLPSEVLDDVIKLLPLTPEGGATETFATVEMGAACAIGTKVPVIGELALEDCEGLALTHLVEHLVKAFEPLTKLWTISKTAEHVSTLLGSAWMRLTGEHKGIKFSWT